MCAPSLLLLAVFFDDASRQIVAQHSLYCYDTMLRELSLFWADYRDYRMRQYVAQYARLPYGLVDARFVPLLEILLLW
jgi:hypothetical protein